MQGNSPTDPARPIHLPFAFDRAQSGRDAPPPYRYRHPMTAIHPAPSTLPLARALALLTPSVLLGGALISQYVGVLYPCEMCMWQRWPHLVAIFFALTAFGLRARPATSLLFTALAAIAIAVSGGIGVFHAGVEYGWWQGLTACSTTATGGSTSEMLDAIMDAPLVRCDVAPWTLLGVSLAGFNAIFSLSAAALVALLLIRAQQEGR